MNEEIARQWQDYICWLEHDILCRFPNISYEKVMDLVEEYCVERVIPPWHPPRD